MDQGPTGVTQMKNSTKFCDEIRMYLQNVSGKRGRSNVVSRSQNASSRMLQVILHGLGIGVRSSVLSVAPIHLEPFNRLR